SLKLAPDRLIGELLASLDRAGLAEYGEHVSALPPATRTARLLVQRDDEITFMERPDPAADADAARAFARLELVMNEYYQHVGALQAVANEKGGKLLEDQHVPGSRP
ncbi:MAG: hypothetical protein H6825_09115, partial [Planctomycetes bacterium]|nr:hypothetical protein [Planctomycetota bacterium]